MVASLQHKKEALEAKIRDKTSELRKVCIEEAELTGTLPPETPLEPGESPPVFRRRVGTSFTFPESLINKLKSKEDEQLSALEVECKIQNGIAEAALGIANDLAVSKSVRRKHRLLYEESTRRLAELEARLNSLRLAQPKQKKKPRPYPEQEGDCVDGGIGSAHSTPDLGAKYPKPMQILASEHHPAERYPVPLMKGSLSYGAFPRPDPNLHTYPQRVLQHPHMDYRHSVMVTEYHHHPLIRSSNPSPNAMVEGWWNKNRELPHIPNLRQSPHALINPQDYYSEPPPISLITDRFGSLDRNLQPVPGGGTGPEAEGGRISLTLPRNSGLPQGSPVSVLLPNQTYPENSLMRTQSLGSVDNSKHHPERKAKEKEWYETSLDSSPPKLSPKIESSAPQNHDDCKSLSFNLENNNTKMNQASINSIQFDTVVPYESPKNHTVVQAGKWQPYREVTKPFEMSDFYKYSTKFRKQTQTPHQAQNISPLAETTENTSPVLQQKGVYKPLQRFECQPVSPLSYSSDTLSLKLSPGNNPQADGRYQNELVNWYHEKANSPKPRSSTLV